ncbi:MAG: DUF61 family protein [Candidatus Methanoplasma sp.]|jgi:uncharacterized protein (UPF0216 family)|nr:DUF61 family protein [Candidatus Methanoplasma sp.]
MSDDPMNVERMIADMNSNMPVNRRSLLDYIDNGNLTYETKSGAVCSFDKEELEFLASKCTEIEKMRLRLPIFVSTDTSYQSGAWKVEGKTEVSVISKVMNKKPYREDFLRLYYPDLKDLRKLLPNLTVTLFLP